MASTSGVLDERLDAVVPGLLVDRRFQRIALQVLVGLHPAVGLHDFQRIGRGRQHIGEQLIRIERDRRDQRLELLGLEQFGLRLGWRRAGRRLRRRLARPARRLAVARADCPWFAPSWRRAPPSASASASKALLQPSIVASIPVVRYSFTPPESRRFDKDQGNRCQATALSRRVLRCTSEPAQRKSGVSHRPEFIDPNQDAWVGAARLRQPAPTTRQALPSERRRGRRPWRPLPLQGDSRRPSSHVKADRRHA